MSAPEIDGLSVVLLGNFNPAIFQPAWLARHSLVRDAEAENAAIELIHSELASYRVGPFTVLVVPTRFQVEVLDVGAASAARDLIAGALTVLPETPVTKVGFNRHMHFRMPDEAAWHRVGHRLAPKEHWDDLGTPGLLSLTVQGQRRGAKSDHIRAAVEPSGKVTPGVYVGINEEFTVSSARAGDAITFVQDQMEDASGYARTMADKIVALARTS